MESSVDQCLLAKLMVFINSSFSLLTLRDVFEGRCYQVLQITIENAPRQRDDIPAPGTGPLTNTARTPTAKAVWGTEH